MTGLAHGHPESVAAQSLSHHLGYKDIMSACAESLAKIKVKNSNCSPLSYALDHFLAALE